METVTKPVWDIRFAEIEDAHALAKIASENSDIPVEDALQVNHKLHPTSTTLVILKDGKPVLYLPFHCLVQVDFFGFAPESGAKDRYRAMQEALKVMLLFCRSYNIGAIQGFSKKGYLMASWAERHGFVVEDRQAFIKYVNEEH